MYSVSGSELTTAAQGLVMVAGATGGSGQRIVEHLLSQGRSVRVLVRDAAKAEALFGQRVQYRIADIKDRQAVLQAAEGVCQLISAMGSRVRNHDELNNGETVDYAGAVHLIEAAQQQAIQHFVMVSTAGLAQSVFAESVKQRPILHWRMQAEQMLRNSGLIYTIVRPGRLLDEPGGRYGLRATQSVDYQRAYGVSRDDVARVCVAALDYAQAQAKTFELINTPDATPPSDWADFFGALQSGLY